MEITGNLHRPSFNGGMFVSSLFPKLKIIRLHYAVDIERRGSHPFALMGKKTEEVIQERLAGREEKDVTVVVTWCAVSNGWCGSLENLPGSFTR